jgi:DNA-binding response OmpR family regulator/curved DNA-binding protein CbpA
LKTVLLAESHAPTLAHLEEMLRMAGYQVRSATEPGAALEQLFAERPDAVIAALDFPRMDGSHLAQIVRGSEQGARIPLLIVDKGHLGRAKGVGAVLELKANGYLADPFKGGELVQKLGSLLAAAPSVATGGVAKTLARTAVVSGELRGSPLPALLHSFHRVQREGVLVVASRDLIRRLYFRQGAVAAYDSTARQDGLVPFLVARGVLTQPQGDQVVQAMGQGLRIGAALVDAGCALEGEVLLARRREFVREKAAQIVAMREGRFAFYAGSEFLEEVPVVDVPALAPVLDGARRTFAVKYFAHPLKPHLGDYPARSASFSKDLAALGLDTDDLKVAMQMNGRIALRDLLAHGRGDLRRIYSLVWFLQLAQSIAFSPKPSADGNASDAETISPRKKKPLAAETITELRDAAVRILASSYFGVLGLSISADAEAVERAYREVAPRFHPDSYPDHDTSEIQDLLESVQDKITAAYRVLASNDKRKAYLQHLVSRLDVGRSGAVNVDAEIAVRRGEAALKRKDGPSAIRAFEEAIALNPREPEYYSYLAWAAYQFGSGGRDDRAKVAQRWIKKALSLNPYLERGLVISAIIDADQGDATGARKKILKALELNPRLAIAKAALRKVNR